MPWASGPVTPRLPMDGLNPDAAGQLTTNVPFSETAEVLAGPVRLAVRAPAPGEAPLYALLQPLSVAESTAVSVRVAVVRPGWYVVLPTTEVQLSAAPGPAGAAEGGRGMGAPAAAATMALETGGRLGFDIDILPDGVGRNPV